MKRVRTPEHDVKTALKEWKHAKTSLAEIEAEIVGTGDFRENLKQTEMTYNALRNSDDYAWEMMKRAEFDDDMMACDWKRDIKQKATKLRNLREANRLLQSDVELQEQLEFAKARLTEAAQNLDWLTRKTNFDEFVLL